MPVLHEAVVEPHRVDVLASNALTPLGVVTLLAEHVQVLVRNVACAGEQGEKSSARVRSATWACWHAHTASGWRGPYR